MKLSISHKTIYNYENPVELNTHSIFLKPLQRSYLTVEDFELTIFPSPNGQVERSSIEGNPFFQVWFTGRTTKLEITTNFKVVIEPFNPFSFIIDLDFIDQIAADKDRLFNYNSREETLLYAYLLTVNAPALRAFADGEFYKNQQNPLGYLMALTAKVRANWKHTIREEENLWSPEYTYEKKEGSCRDLSWMLIHMLRMQGMAARFVSGYAFNPEIAEGHELHAWVEAYLPGAGWVGIDPSLGLFTDQNYIPLACSSDAQNTLPIHGNYAGASGAQLSTYVEITKLNSH